jgi:hypothetical protein
MTTGAPNSKAVLEASRAVSTPTYSEQTLLDAFLLAASTTYLEHQLCQAEDMSPFLVTIREEDEPHITHFRLNKTTPDLESLMKYRVPGAIIAKQAQVAVLAVVIFGDEDFGLRWPSGDCLDDSYKEPREYFGSSFLVGTDLNDTRLFGRALIGDDCVGPYYMLGGDAVRPFVPDDLAKTLSFVSENCSSS